MSGISIYLPNIRRGFLQASVCGWLFCKKQLRVWCKYYVHLPQTPVSHIGYITNSPGIVRFKQYLVWELQWWERPLRVQSKCFWSLSLANNEEHWFKAALLQYHSCSVGWPGQVRQCFDCPYSLKSKFNLHHSPTIKNERRHHLSNIVFQKAKDCASAPPYLTVSVIMCTELMHLKAVLLQCSVIMCQLLRKETIHSFSDSLPLDLNHKIQIQKAHLWLLPPPCCVGDETT